MRAYLLLAAIGLCTAAHAAPPGGPSCDERMGKLAARMKALAADSPHDFRVSVPLPRAGKAPQGAPLDKMGWMVVVDAAGKATHDPFKDAERASVAWPIYFAVEDRTPAAAVARALAEARAAGLRGEARLLVAVPPPPAEPTDAALLAVPSVEALRRELEGAGHDPSNKAVLIAHALQKAIPPCSPVVRIYGAMAAMDPVKKAEALLKVPAAMAECKCAVMDVDLFEYAMLVLLDAFSDGQRWLPLPALGARDTRTMRDVIRN